MGVFGNTYITKEEEISESEQIILMDLFTQAVLEDYFSEDELDSIDEACEVVTEGTNFQGFKAMRAAKKAIRKHKKDYKKAMKAGRYNEAVRAAEEMKKEIDVIKKDVTALNWDNTTTATIGFLTALLIEIAQTMVVALLIKYTIGGIVYGATVHGVKKAAKTADVAKFLKTLKRGYKGAMFAHNAGMFGGMIKALVSCIKNLNAITDEKGLIMKNTKTGNEAMNVFRTQIFRIIDTCGQAADQLIKDAKEADKK